MKPRENITLAPATAENAALAADIIYDTGYHGFGWQYDGPENFCKLAAYMWETDDAVWSHKRAVIAEEDGQMIGLELGWTQEELEETNKVFVEQSLAAIGPELTMKAGERWDYLRFLVPPVPEDAYYLSNLGLVPKARGKRIGDILLSNAFTKAKKAGLRELHLDVASTKPAVGFYKRMGMECRAETNMPPIADHVPMHYRMVMDLSVWEG